MFVGARVNDPGWRGMGHTCNTTCVGKCSNKRGKCGAKLLKELATLSIECITRTITRSCMPRWRSRLWLCSTINDSTHIIWFAIFQPTIRQTIFHPTIRLSVIGTTTMIILLVITSPVQPPPQKS